MKSSAMIDTIENNSRTHELKLRQVEKNLSAAHEHELRINHNLAQALKVFAKTQVAGNADATHDLQRKLDKRSEAEQALRTGLLAAEALVSQQNDLKQTILSNIEDVIEKADADLSSDSAYQQLYAQTHLAVTTAAAAESSYKEIEAECSAKLTFFKEDRLYSYLRASNYGTSQYTRGKLIRAFDQWIAGLCNFSQNFSTEKTLAAMQEANTSGHMERLSTRDALRRELTATVQRARSKAGYEALETKLQQAESSLKEAKSRANRLQDELDTFASKTDHYFVEAQAELAKHLNTLSEDALQGLAEETDEQSDDEQVGRIAEYRRQRVQVQEEVKILTEEQVLAKKAYERAKDLERDLRSSRYTSSSYRYSDSLDMESLVLGYMAGTMSQRDVVDEVDSNRQRIPSESSSFGGSTGFGSSGGSFSTSSFGGGGSFSTSDSL